MARKVETASFNKHKVSDMLPIQRERRGFEDGENMSGLALLLDSRVQKRRQVLLVVCLTLLKVHDKRDRDGPGAYPAASC